MTFVNMMRRPFILRGRYLKEIEIGIGISNFRNAVHPEFPLLSLSYAGFPYFCTWETLGKIAEVTASYK